jgi:hypothetical protein
MGWGDFFFNGADVAEVIGAIARAVPAALMFPCAFITMQGLLTGNEARDMGAAAAIRATLHGAHLDAQGLAWSIGVAGFLTALGIVLRKWQAVHAKGTNSLPQERRRVG